MGNVFDKGELCVDDLFHGPIDLFDVGIGRHGVHGAKHLRDVHDVAGVEERDAVLVPLFAIVAAQVLAAPLPDDIEDDLHFDINDFPDTFHGQVHEAALLFKAEDFLDNGHGFSLIEEAKDGGLYLLHDVAAGHVAGVHIREQESAELAAFGLLEELEGSLGDDARCLRSR